MTTFKKANKTTDVTIRLNGEKVKFAGKSQLKFTKNGNKNILKLEI